MMKTPLDINDSDGHPTDLPQEYTFYGSLSYGINVLKRISPQAKFVMIYPFYGIYKDGNGAYLGDSFVVSNGIFKEEHRFLITCFGCSYSLA